MEKPARLFDLFEYQLQNNPLEVSLAEKKSGEWVGYSTAEVIEKINALSRGLYKYGVRENDKIAIVANSSPVWTWLDIAIQQVGAISVPVYPNISFDDYRFIFNDSEVKLAFVGDKMIYKKLEPLLNIIPSLQKFFSLTEVTGVTPWTELLNSNEQIDQSIIEGIKAKIAPNDLVTIIYTSGTTGTPKGVMLSHYNVLSNSIDCAENLPIKTYHRILSSLPICHIFERMACFFFVYVGVSIYYAEGLEKLGDNLREVKPHFFTTVPRLLEKVYEKLLNKSKELKGIQKKIYDWAIIIANKYDPDRSRGPMYEFQRGIADKLVYRKWRDALGGNLVGVVSGAAALQPRLAKFFNAAGIPLREGYGQTEASPVISFNRFEEGGSRVGTVGPPIPSVKVKIASDGEICIKGPNVMLGYYKRPDLTAEAIDAEGWLHTGDVGELIDGKFIKITDRKKELFKTSGGKYVAPQVIENAFRESFFVDQIIIIGENKKTISALIVPSIPTLQQWIEQQGHKFSSKEEMLKSPLAMKKFAEIRDEVNKRFGEVEKVKKFALIPDEWTVETGELTPTMKIKRKVVLEKYKQLINDIYGDE